MRANQLGEELAAAATARDANASEVAGLRAALQQEKEVAAATAAGYREQLAAVGKELEGLRKQLADKTDAAGVLEAELEGLKAKKVGTNGGWKQGAGAMRSLFKCKAA